MSQTDNRQPLERFVTEYDAIPTAEHEGYESGTQSVYIDPDEVVTIGDDVWSFASAANPIAYDEPLTEWDVVGNDGDTPRLCVAVVDGEEYTYQPEYIELVADVFGVNIPDVGRNAYSKATEHGTSHPLYYDHPDSELSAIVAPYIP